MAKKTKRDDPSAEILIYEPIGADYFGGVTAKQVALELAPLGARNVLVRLNSPGGDFSDAVAIFNLLRAHRGVVTVQIDAEASSAASIVALGGDHVRMAPGSFMMIHEPWTVIAGNADELRGAAVALDKLTMAALDIYDDRTTTDRLILEKWLKAETWLTAEEALDAGFATELGGSESPEALDAAALVDPMDFFHFERPAAFRERRERMNKAARLRDRVAALAGRLAEAQRKPWER